MPRVLLLATTTGYQTRAFSEAAERLGIDVVYATDRCNVLEDPWQDEAIPIRFHDEAASAAALVEATGARPIDGVLAVGDRPTVIAALVSEALGLPWHPPRAAAVARNKKLTREALRSAGLPVPWFATAPLTSELRSLLPSIAFPCVVKPLALSGSRGVMRADDEAQLVSAFDRLAALLRSSEVRSERTGAHDGVIIEGFIPGREFAVEALMDRGALHVLAIFDKPDPLDGPFFEETIYVTPSRAGEETTCAISEAIRRAAQAIGLVHGPIHAECRVSEGIAYVLEVAARPIGGLCARALRFQLDRGAAQDVISLEELLLRHAIGESPGAWTRESAASGVMMMPIPRRGVLRGASGIDEARGVSGVEDIRITAKPDQVLVPLPEGASYLGFIFARGDTAAAVEHALREAHARIDFTIDPEVRVLQSHHG